MAQPASYPPATPPPPPGTAPMRPGSVTAAGVLLIVLGSFAAIGGLLMIAGGAFLASGEFTEQFGGGFGDLFQAAAGFAVIAGVLAVAYAVFKIISGAKVLALRNGWRIAGIVFCAVAMVGWLIVLIGSFRGREETTFDVGTGEFITAAGGADIGGIIFSLAFLAANTVTLILLARAGRAFPR
jgi:hypothetical protein